MKYNDPQLTLLLGQVLQPYQSNQGIDETEFSNAIAKMEKRMIQFALGSAYLVGNRNLHEFTLSLKDYSKVKTDATEPAEENGDDDINDE